MHLNLSSKCPVSNLTLMSLPQKQELQQDFLSIIIQISYRYKSLNHHLKLVQQSFVTYTLQLMYLVIIILRSLYLLFNSVMTSIGLELSLTRNLETCENSFNTCFQAFFHSSHQCIFLLLVFYLLSAELRSFFQL